MKSLFFFLWLFSPLISRGAEKSVDIVVYGSTPAGIAAAISAGREGREVLLIEPGNRIGGLPAGGLSNTDFRSFDSLGGIWRTFMDRIIAHYGENYGEDSPQFEACQKGGTFEPKVALQVFEEMLEEVESVELWKNLRLVSATVKNDGNSGKKITSIVLKSSKGISGTISARVFIDATYEGDLMAAAGVPYAVGAEGKNVYGETVAPDETHGNLQVFNYRVTLCKNSKNRREIPKPEGYEREDFRLLIDSIVKGKSKNLDTITRGPIRPLPNLKADFNDRQGSAQSLRIYETAPWADGDEQIREEIRNRATYQALGLFWTILHDPEIGESANGRKIRAELEPWGLPLDEYEESGNWSPALYVREARRMIGNHIYQEKDLYLDKDSVRTVARADAIAMGDYPATSHGTYREKGKTIGVINHHVRTWPTRPHQIPYGVILPKETDGLLVPVAASSSHIGFCALRLEPLWTGMGEAAGIAAHLALEQGIPLREVDPTEIQSLLHDHGAFTFYTTDSPPGSEYFREIQYFGNRGFFQHLTPPGANGGSSKLSGKNQWFSAYYNHDTKPDEKMTEELVTMWTAEASKLGIPDVPQNPGELNRGEFLRFLYKQVFPKKP